VRREPLGEGLGAHRRIVIGVGGDRVRDSLSVSTIYNVEASST
jgi:hypothetical protein